jgi:hypothetical protein
MGYVILLLSGWGTKFWSNSNFGRFESDRTTPDQVLHEEARLFLRPGRLACYGKRLGLGFANLDYDGRRAEAGGYGDGTRLRKISPTAPVGIVLTIIGE